MLVIEDGGKDSSYMTLFTSKAVIFFKISISIFLIRDVELFKCIFFFKFWAPKYTRFLHFHYIQEKADISAAKILFWNKH